jgi:hypothetical protein
MKCVAKITKLMCVNPKTRDIKCNDHKQHKLLLIYCMHGHVMNEDRKILMKGKRKGKDE